ncbi:MAG: type II secretion system protein [Patescibacteria group bacterium]
MNKKLIFIKKKGFTLIELLLVVAIIGLLAALAIAAFTEIRTNARDARRISDLRALQQALEMYHSDNGYYPSGDIGSNSSSGFCIERTLGADGSCISGKFCDLIKNYLPRLPKDPNLIETIIILLVIIMSLVLTINLNLTKSPLTWKKTEPKPVRMAELITIIMKSLI